MADSHGIAWAGTVRAAIAALVCLWLLLGAGTARAQPGPDDTVPVPPMPEVAGRVTPLHGQVGITLPGEPAPIPADNRPLAGGERIETAADARALIALGSTALRLGPQADLVLRQLSAAQVVLELRAGSAALQIATQEWADRIVLMTPEGQWWALRPGHYRIDRWADATRATAWEGDLRFDAEDRTLVVPAARFAEVTRLAPSGATEVAWGEPVPDEFAEWVQRDARIAAQAAALRHVSPEVVGWEDLDRHGDWVTDPEWGSLWLPSGVGAGWTPYLDGRWVWVASWGWTWVDPSSWGFAPFHYGRWQRWHGRWAWTPGPRYSPPRFSPAPPHWLAPPRSHPAPPAVQPPDHRPPRWPDRSFAPGPSAPPEPPRAGRHPPLPPAAPGGPHDPGMPGSGGEEGRRHRQPMPDVSHRPAPTPPGAMPPIRTPPSPPGEPSPPGGSPPRHSRPPPAVPTPGGQGAPPAAPGRTTTPRGPIAPGHDRPAPAPATGAPADPGRVLPPGIHRGQPGDRHTVPPAEPIRTRPTDPPREQATGMPAPAGGSGARPATR